MTNAELKEMLLVAARENHIWLSAFSCIRPTDEFLRELGRTVVRRLENSENLLPVWHGDDSDTEVSKLQTLTPVLYLSINKS